MKPSKFKEPVFHKSKILPPKGFMAITLFGHVFVREEYWLWQFSSNYDGIYWSKMKWHETIHIRQAAKEKDSWFIFYMKYLGYWIRNMFHCKFNNRIAYKCIPYEMEAYYQEVKFTHKEYNCENLQKFKDFPYREALKKAKDPNWYQTLTDIANV